MNKIKIIGFVIAILFGAFLFVYGEYDDSPGGQVLGLVAVIVGIVGIIKSRKKLPTDDKILTRSNFMISNIISWIFGVVFFVIGVLNAFLVHLVPGAFYIILSFVYFPPVNDLLKKRLGFSIPFAVKVVLGLVILWGTLAVGDLAEMFGL